MNTPKNEFNLKKVLDRCYWAAKEYRDNPADAYIVEKIVGFIDSNNLFAEKYADLSVEMPPKFIDKNGCNRYDLLLKSYLELEKRLSIVYVPQSPTPPQERVEVEKLKISTTEADVSFMTADEIKGYNKAIDHLHAQGLLGSSALPDGYVLVRFDKPITSYMKAECIGEFSFITEEVCTACYYDKQEEECEVCGGEVTYSRENIVPWDTCKQIYKAMLAAAPKTGAE